jgi:hypothetical protein
MPLIECNVTVEPSWPKPGRLGRAGFVVRSREGEDLSPCAITSLVTGWQAIDGVPKIVIAISGHCDIVGSRTAA